MAAYDFGYGYSPARGQARPGAAGPGSYGYRPQYGWSNPFAAWRPSEVDFDYYAENPQAVFGRYLAANAVGGPEGVAPSFRSFLEGWLPDAYAQWQGEYPLGNTNQGFADWLGGQDPMNAYELSNPYARTLRAGYRTRYLRR